jgi:hypothetical protein
MACSGCCAGRTGTWMGVRDDVRDYVIGLMGAGPTSRACPRPPVLPAAGSSGASSAHCPSVIVEPG